MTSRAQAILSMFPTVSVYKSRVVAAFAVLGVVGGGVEVGIGACVVEARVVVVCVVVVCVVAACSFMCVTTTTRPITIMLRAAFDVPEV